MITDYNGMGDQFQSPTTLEYDHRVYRIEASLQSEMVDLK